MIKNLIKQNLANEFNYHPNRYENDPKIIIIHWTAGSYKSTIEWFKNKDAGVSSHYVIKEDGLEITQMVPDDAMAYHAGVSYHPLVPNYMNVFSFGIELVGPPSMIGLDKWNNNQIKSTADLCKYLKSNYSSIIGIADHSSIVKFGRKQDVKLGKDKDLFPWDYFISLTNMKDLTAQSYIKKIKKYFGE